MEKYEDLFSLSQHYFEIAVAHLATQGIHVSSVLELCPGNDLLCYYDVSQQKIYLSLPTQATPQGKLQLLLLRSLLACKSNAEVFEFLQLILHWLLIHEIAHHLRYQMGVLTVNIWQEEQIANQLAIALSKPLFTPQQRVKCEWFLTRATHNLLRKVAVGSSAVDAYHSLPHSLHSVGLMDTATLHQIKQIQQETGLLAEAILEQNLVDAPADIHRRIYNRHRIIERINSALKQDIFQYLYYYFGWMNIALRSNESYSVQEFSRHFLDRHSEGGMT